MIHTGMRRPFSVRRLLILKIDTVSCETDSHPSFTGQKIPYSPPVRKKSPTKFFLTPINNTFQNFRSLLHWERIFPTYLLEHLGMFHLHIMRCRNNFHIFLRLAAKCDSVYVLKLIKCPERSF